MTEAQQLWNNCSSALRSQVSEATWKAWFSGVQPVAVVRGELVLSVPSAVVRDRLEGRFRALLRDALVDASGKEYPVRFDVEVDDAAEVDTVSYQERLPETAWPGRSVGFGGTAPPAPDTTTFSAQQFATSPAPDHKRASARSQFPSNDIPLNTRYTFDSFVTGPSNRFSYAAALSVAEGPAKSYNPLFVYGGVGLGKTHLLQAIGNYVRENFSHLRVRYVSTETFMNEFVETLRAKDDMSAFRRRYRECDVLLIDDVQFMDRKESLQEELFHTFNSLYGASRQIVITSDRPPKAIATLENRLRSRLLAGLTTHVEPPEIETRIAILQTKAEREGAVVGDDVLEFIAANVKDNIRELEGALTRVTAFASLNRQPLTLETAEVVLADHIVAREPRQITAQQIITTTAQHFGFSVEDVCGQSRRRPLVIARQTAMYLFRELTDYSYPAIGREFGGRDHTTVMHAVDKIASLMKERRQLYNTVTELLVRLKNSG